jgi:hypothetical protein
MKTEINISNINKPTPPFWNKVIAASAAGSAFLASYGLVSNHQVFVVLGGVLGLIGTMLPVFISNK